MESLVNQWEVWSCVMSSELSDDARLSVWKGFDIERPCCIRDDEMFTIELVTPSFECDWKWFFSSQCDESELVWSYEKSGKAMIVMWDVWFQDWESFFVRERRSSGAFVIYAADKVMNWFVASEIWKSRSLIDECNMSSRFDYGNWEQGNVSRAQKHEKLHRQNTKTTDKRTETASRTGGQREHIQKNITLKKKVARTNNNCT